MGELYKPRCALHERLQTGTAAMKMVAEDLGLIELGSGKDPIFKQWLFVHMCWRDRCTQRLICGRNKWCNHYHWQMSL
jgi:hypothetical protein